MAKSEWLGQSEVACLVVMVQPVFLKMILVDILLGVILGLILLDAPTMSIGSFPLA